MSDPGSGPQLERIEPAKVTLSHQAGSGAAAERPTARLSPLALGALALGLGLLGLGALNQLTPGSSTKDGAGAPKPLAEGSSAPPTATAPPMATPAGETAPFASAQAQALREQAQGTLRQLLVRRTALEDHGATRWAAKALSAIQQQAEAGDAAFLAGALEDSLARYEGALAEADALWAQVPERQAQTAQAAEAALAENRVGDAREAFALLEALAGEDGALRAQAERGLARSAVRPKVLERTQAARLALGNGELAEAQTQLAAAAALDGEAKVVRTLQAELTARKNALARDEALAKGYAALDRKAFDAAQGHFEAALRFDGGATAAQEGLALLARARLEGRLAALQARAEAARRKGAFEDALAQYEAALALDPTLAFALTGQRLMTERLRLTEALTMVEARLGRDPSEAVLAHAQETLAAATPFLSEEPALATRIAALRQRLSAASEPRTVRLFSDGKTAVQVLRVRHFGVVTAQNVPLRPGDYVALGSRDGYRDVRVPFTVPLDSAGPEVAVICQDPI